MSGAQKLIAKAVRDENQKKQAMFHRYLTEGHPAMTTANFLCGIATAAVGIQMFIRCPKGTCPRGDRVIYAYLVFYGLLIMLMELVACFLSAFKVVQRRIEKWAKFLGRLWGRGLFYIYVGILLVCIDMVFARITGCVLILLGIFGIVASRFAAERVKKLRRLIKNTNKTDDPEKIREFFDMYDTDRSGYIDKTELKELSSMLGFPLEGTQLEGAFHSLDKDQNGKIMYDEFVRWWTGKDLEMI
jgi:hypothetical protein